MYINHPISHHLPVIPSQTLAQELDHPLGGTSCYKGITYFIHRCSFLGLFATPELWRKALQLLLLLQHGAACDHRWPQPDPRGKWWQTGQSDTWNWMNLGQRDGSSCSITGSCRAVRVSNCFNQRSCSRSSASPKWMAYSASKHGLWEECICICLIVLISFVRCAQRNNSKCPQLPSHPDPRQLPSSSWPSEAPAKEDLLLIIPEAIRIHNDLHYIDYMTISIQICSLQNPITRYQSKSSICSMYFCVICQASTSAQP